MTEKEFLVLIQKDQQMMTILNVIADLGLKDCWLAAGSVRNYIWNVQSGLPVFDTETDLDVVFYDSTVSYQETQTIENHLKEAHPDYPWELKNQVFMHVHNPDTVGYESARDAISKYPETATAVALRLIDDELELFAPYGLDVISRFEIHPTPHFKASDKRMAVYNERMARKNWSSKWPQIKIYQD
ncbi:nucleotidyltransferase family protein [Streptococcus pluranimalium]|uniref:nucleotidyltransferase family protein n=1 Tax=Streptococcus pluranimalium TaxID=82348 RepID=UPI0039FDA26F